ARSELRLGGNPRCQRCELPALIAQAGRLAMRNNGTDDETDVIVVGGGGAGLTAAIFARKAGARVVLFEKDRQLGGATRLCVGTYTAAGTRLQKTRNISDSADLHMQDMFRVLGRHPDDESADLRRIMAVEAAEMLDWLS